MRAERGPMFLSRRRGVVADLHNDDPATAVVNLFDVAILIGVGFLVVALSGFGLKELLSRGRPHHREGPGWAEHGAHPASKDGKIERLRNTGSQAKIGGDADRHGVSS